MNAVGELVDGSDVGLEETVRGRLLEAGGSVLDLLDA
jgi:hypothetical protein